MGYYYNISLYKICKSNESFVLKAILPTLAANLAPIIPRHSKIINRPSLALHAVLISNIYGNDEEKLSFLGGKGRLTYTSKWNKLKQSRG